MGRYNINNSNIKLTTKLTRVLINMSAVKVVKDKVLWNNCMKYMFHLLTGYKNAVLVLQALLHKNHLLKKKSAASCRLAQLTIALLCMRCFNI